MILQIQALFYLLTFLLQINFTCLMKKINFTSSFAVFHLFLFTFGRMVFLNWDRRRSDYATLCLKSQWFFIFFLRAKVRLIQMVKKIISPVFWSLFIYYILREIPDTTSTRLVSPVKLSRHHAFVAVLAFITIVYLWLVSLLIKCLSPSLDCKFDDGRDKMCFYNLSLATNTGLNK